jgi:3-isopropylmalate dehydratase small subunit
MMKKITILYALLISAIISAQQTVHIDVDWKDVKISTSGNVSYTVPGFNEENFEYRDDIGLQFATKWKELSKHSKLLL